MNIDDLYLNDFKPIVYETTCTVSELGTVKPVFKLDSNHYTSGELKYLHLLKSKQIKITIELLRTQNEMGTRKTKC